MKTQLWYFLKRFIPVSIYSSLVYFYFRSRGLFYPGSNIECPCCKKKFSKWVHSGKFGSCPGCGAASRHRNLYYFLEMHQNLFDNKGLRILHFAPENGSSYFFSHLKECDYVTADLNSPRAEIKIDMTHIPFADNSFDIVLSVHVLEHVPDDLKAMKELFRILKPGGYSIHQVPIDYNRELTFEDSSLNTNKLRNRHFGHPDHKRIYGRDYLDRLCDAGFTVKPLEFFKNLPVEVIKKFGLNPSEIIYLCSK